MKTLIIVGSSNGEGKIFFPFFYVYSFLFFPFGFELLYGFWLNIYILLIRTILNYVYDSIVCVYTYTRMPPRLADHPQDERSHLTITRTDERFDLWSIIINYYLYFIYYIFEGI